MRRGCWFAAGLMAAWIQGACAASLMTDRLSGCQIFVPDDWAGGTVRWTGACDRSMASGLGTAVRYVDGIQQATFFGDLTTGRMTRGVIEVAGGYQAGLFRNGEPVRTDDRNTIIAAFRVAAEAARAASARFQADGNTGSAAFYAAAAEALERQMD